MNTKSRRPIGRAILSAILAVMFAVMAGCGGGGGGSSAPATQLEPGLGDQANYFPFAIGNAWRYHGVELTNGQGQIDYFSTTKVTGIKLVNGINTTAFTTTNVLN